jgi:hypothetical protein
MTTNLYLIGYRSPTIQPVFHALLLKTQKGVELLLKSLVLKVLSAQVGSARNFLSTRYKVLGTILVLMFATLNLQASDSICPIGKFKYKIGLKFAAEKSQAYQLTPEQVGVYNFGFQFLANIKAKASLETGFYLMSRAIDFGGRKFYYRNLSIPANLRFDLCRFFVSAGFFADYLVAVNPAQPLDRNRKINFGYNIGAGIQHRLTDKWTVFAEGRYFNTLNNLFYASGLPAFSNTGVGIGINMKI